MNNKKMYALLVPMLGMAMIASAQDTGGSSGTGTSGTSTNRGSQSGSTSGTSSTTGSTSRAGDMSAMRHLMLVPSGEVINAKVVSQQGDTIGKVEDIVLNQAGEAAYAVIKPESSVGITGDKLLAVPWSVLQCKPSTSATGSTGTTGSSGSSGSKGTSGSSGTTGSGGSTGSSSASGSATGSSGMAGSTTAMNSMKDCVLVLNIDKERLKSAPTFDRAKWPDLANATSWARDLDQYYASDMRSTTGRPIEAGARLGTASFKATDLKGKNVESTTGDKIGEIKDFVLDPNSGRVALVVLSVGGFLGMGEHHVAVPFEALHVTKGDTAGKEKFTLSTTKERLTSAPEFKTGQEHWTEMSDPAYVSRVYDYYSIRPYWNMSGSTGGMDDGSGSGGGGGG